MYHHNRYRTAILGVDLGQTQDPTALALLVSLEQTTSPHTWYDATHPKRNHWLLAYADILPLGTTYTQIAATISTKLKSFKLRHPNIPVRVAVDSTGLGAPVTELIHYELGRQSTPPLRQLARLEGIIFTSGTAVTEKSHPSLPIDLFLVPKLTLMNSLATAIESKILTIPATLPHADILIAQLRSLEITQKN